MPKLQGTSAHLFVQPYVVGTVQGKPASPWGGDPLSFESE